MIDRPLLLIVVALFAFTPPSSTEARERVRRAYTRPQAQSPPDQVQR